MKKIVSLALALSMILTLTIAGISVGQAEQVTEFTLYKAFPGNVQQYAASYEELPLYKEIEKRTNTKLTFMSPPVGQEKEQFNLIIASGDYPDLFVDLWDSYAGGAAKALADNVIISLNTLIDEYAPNIKAAMEQYPDAFRYVTNEKGEIYGIPMVFTDNMQRVVWGINIRKDWLDELNLQLPETVSEYHDVLKAFKEEKGATAPFTITFDHLKNSRFIAGAYHVSTSFYQENGTIKFGPCEEGYKDYLKVLHQWYEEGLLDKDFATIDGNTRGAKMLNGQAGMTWAPSKGGIQAWTSGLRETKPDANVVGGAHATLVKGELPSVGQVNAWGNMSGAISSTCKDPVKAIQFFDYFFSEEGRLLVNFGIEGLTYEMVDGNPQFTDMILKATDMPVISKLNFYATSAEGKGGIPTIVDPRYVPQINSTFDNVAEALQIWGATSTFESEIPGITPLTEDSSRYATIMNEVTTYTDEMTLKFIMGLESIDDTFDKYVANIHSKGIDEAISIMQKAYDSFMNR